MVRKLLMLFVVLCLVSTGGFAASKGTSGAQFLKIIGAPRPSALGGTYAAFSDDVNSIVCNPAGLGYLEKKEMVLVQNSWIQDISNQYFAFAMPTERMGTFGVSVIMLSVKDIDKVNNAGTNTGTYDASDRAVSLAYGKKLSGKLGFGLNVKSISSTIEEESASAIAADIGALYNASEKLDIGLVAQNVGTEIKFIAEGDPLPMTIKLGSAYQASSKLLLGLDVSAPNDSDLYVSAGGEFAIPAGEKLVFPIRLGYRTGMETGGLSGLGTGLGIVYDKLFGIDFSWTPVGDLGDSMKFGLRFIF